MTSHLSQSETIKPDQPWNDVRAALDAQGYAGRPLDGTGRILADAASTAQYALQLHVAHGTIPEAPLIEVKAISAPRGGHALALYIRGEDEPRWTT